MAKKTTTARVANQIKKADTLTKVEDLMIAVVKEFGGVGEFAKSYVSDYRSSPPGSVARSRLLEGTSRLVHIVSKKDSPTVLDDMTDGEIEREIESRIARIVERTGTIDTSKEQPDDGTPTPD